MATKRFGSGRRRLQDRCSRSWFWKDTVRAYLKPLAVTLQPPSTSLQPPAVTLQPPSCSILCECSVPDVIQRALGVINARKSIHTRWDVAMVWTRFITCECSFPCLSTRALGTIKAGKRARGMFQRCLLARMFSGRTVADSAIIRSGLSQVRRMMRKKMVTTNNSEVLNVSDR